MDGSLRRDSFCLDERWSFASFRKSSLKCFPSPACFLLPSPPVETLQQSSVSQKNSDFTFQRKTKSQMLILIYVFFTLPNEGQIQTTVLTDCYVASCLGFFCSSCVVVLHFESFQTVFFSYQCIGPPWRNSNTRNWSEVILLKLQGCRI